MSAALEAMIDRCFHSIESSPEILHTGGPEGMEAAVIAARLYGLDGELVTEVRLSGRVPPVYRLPISRRPTLTMASAESPLSAIHVADYDLQSNYATAKVAAELAPGLPHDEQFLVSVLCVRYRRRPIARA